MSALFKIEIKKDGETENLIDYVLTNSYTVQAENEQDAVRQVEEILDKILNPNSRDQYTVEIKDD